MGQCYGTSSLEHPGVQMIAMERGQYYLGGKITGLDIPKRIFPCATPRETCASLPEGKDVVAFQCRNPLHRVHVELFLRSLDAETSARAPSPRAPHRGPHPGRRHLRGGPLP